MGSIDEKNLKIDENLKNIDVSVSNCIEKRAAHILERAKLISSADSDEYRKRYEALFSGQKDNFDVLDENMKYVSSVRKTIDMYDKIKCVDIFFPRQKTTVFSEENDIAFNTNTVVYLKNPLADIAFNKFSKCLNDARVLYQESFTDVCEEVYYSRQPYCVLPIENSDDGRLSGFRNMIRKYELKIVLTCNVESANGKVTKFALLKRELAKIDCPEAINEGEYLEIGFNFGEEAKLVKVLEAANYFGYKLNKVDSLPIYYSEKEYYFDAVFSGNGDIKRFMFWLELEVPRYEIIGIYTHIKATAGKNGG